MPWKPWPQTWAQGWKNTYGKYPQYPQFQQSYLIFPPQFFSQPVQPSQPQNSNPQLSIPFRQRPNKLPSQPLPNQNNNKS